MVAGKPATNSLLLTNQQTGTVQPGGSMEVSFSFHATSVGRWKHDLAVRNLGNKHDQASGVTMFFFFFSFLCVVLFWRCCLHSSPTGAALVETTSTIKKAGGVICFFFF